MAVPSEGPNPAPLPRLPKRFRYHVAFSYTSADAEYVDAVSAALPEGIKHFDYRTDGTKVENWGHDLKQQLQRVYGNMALFCVVFISNAYVSNKTWTEQEWKVASRVAKRKPGYVLPVLLDGTKVRELEHLVWLDRLPPGQLAELITGAIRRPPPKPWWFYVSTEVKIALGAVLLALILFARPAVNYFRPSRTSVASVQVDAQAITAHLVNSGPKNATVVGQRLKFGALPIEDTALRLDKSTSGTIAPGARDVKLIALELLTKCNAEGIRPNKYTIERILAQQPVTLVIDIRESDDPPGQSTRRSVTFPAARLKPLVGKAVSGYDSDTGC